jgi:hypothetical protein
MKKTKRIGKCKKSILKLNPPFSGKNYAQGWNRCLWQTIGNIPKYLNEESAEGFLKTVRLVVNCLC